MTTHKHLYDSVEKSVAEGVAKNEFNPKLVVPWSGAETRHVDRLLEVLLGPDDFLKLLAAAPKHDMAAGERNPEIDAFLRKIAVDVRESDAEAAYTPRLDFIRLPHISQFATPALYYKVLFHEIGHWTGHASRLDRLAFMQEFSEKIEYVAEELTAEMTAAYLSAYFGLPDDGRHVSYINNWMRSADPTILGKAMAKAKAAFEYLIRQAGLDAGAKGTHLSETEMSV